MTNIAQNAHLTFKANRGIGRHDWLRLTPAYSVNLVERELEKHDRDSVIFDPFSGTGTTGLCAAYKGYRGILADVNPFLVWLAKAKSYRYSDQEISNSYRKLDDVLRLARSARSANFWVPPIHNIERWWNSSSLSALSRLKFGIDSLEQSSENDLLLISFCDVLIKASNAVFNHQSVSFKPSLDIGALFKYESEGEAEEQIFLNYVYSCRRIIDSAKMPLAGSVEVFQADSRRMDISRKVDIVITSPPYVNRMSYIRELRPYMYWLKFINEAKEAGELDWKAIGGTWGTATSKLNNWSDERKLPIQEIKTITEKIAQGDSKNGRLLGNYVMKYFYDMWEHFLALHETVNNGGSIVYIIGNSSFYGNVVPAEKWYGELMAHAGFKEVQIETIRKRNSNKALYEFAVRAKRI